VDSDSIGFCHFLLFLVFSQKLLKQLLSLTINVADPAVYMISGLLPLEAEIHTKVFTMFGNITRAHKNSTKKW
jgi:hypothetical protein